MAIEQMIASSRRQKRSRSHSMDFTPFHTTFFKVRVLTGIRCVRGVVQNWGRCARYKLGFSQFARLGQVGLRSQPNRVGASSSREAVPSLPALVLQEGIGAAVFTGGSSRDTV